MGRYDETLQFVPSGLASPIVRGDSHAIATSGRATQSPLAIFPRILEESGSSAGLFGGHDRAASALLPLEELSSSDGILVTPEFKVDEGAPTELMANSLSAGC